ncbi:PrpF domain-containing protein [Aeromonas caviae]|uniref:PrpF domain-containing protein n=1 Tax=Aeromonas caviae TaxID=648 RepID=UPI0021086840|nr:PrpF domain-containing protein [Aeromonas caviae]
MAATEVEAGKEADQQQHLHRQHTPKIAFVAPAKDYRTASGKEIIAGEIDLLVRALSMGKLHHAMMGTCAVAIGTAVTIRVTMEVPP